MQLATEVVLQILQQRSFISPCRAISYFIFPFFFVWLVL